jgi:hypothetical protein
MGNQYMQIEEDPLRVEADITCLVLKIDEYLIGLGFTKTVVDPNIYYLFDRSDLLVLV